MANHPGDVPLQGRMTENGWQPWWPEVWPTPIKKCALCSPPWWLRLLTPAPSLHGKDHPPYAHADYQP